MKIQNQYISLVTQVHTQFFIMVIRTLVDTPFKIWSGHGCSTGVNMATCFSVNHYSITSYSWCINGKCTSIKSPVFYTKATEGCVVVCNVACDQLKINTSSIFDFSEGIYCLIVYVG